MTLTIASTIFNAQLFSCLLPCLLLIGLVTWYVYQAERAPNPDEDFLGRDNDRPSPGSTPTG